jgi:hypothetical protein
MSLPYWRVQIRAARGDVSIYGSRNNATTPLWRQSMLRRSARTSMDDWYSLRNTVLTPESNEINSAASLRIKIRVLVQALP